MADPTDKIKSESVDEIPQGMLSSPQIQLYFHHGWLVDDYDISCLGPASYNMRLAGTVITKKDGTSVEFILAENEDKNLNQRNRVVLAPNSLTFVTTYEKFKLPRNVIARYNLKSKLVHKGLLLGTGPIVDPDFEGNLLIPLHNFSDAPVELRYKDKFITVEFTKTLPANETYKVKKKDDESVDCAYVKNDSSDYDFLDFIKRVGGELPESSIASILIKAQKEREKAEKETQQFKSLSFWAAIVMLIGLITLVFTTWSVLSDASNSVADAAAIVKKSEKIDYDLRDFATENELDQISTEISQLKGNMRGIDTRLKTFQNNGKAYAANSFFKEIQQRIVFLEKEVERLSKIKDSSERTNDGLQ